MGPLLPEVTRKRDQIVASLARSSGGCHKTIGDALIRRLSSSIDSRVLGIGRGHFIGTPRTITYCSAQYITDESPHHNLYCFSGR